MPVELPAGWSEIPLKVQPFDLANPLAAAAKIQAERATTADTQAQTATRNADLPRVQAESQLAQAITGNRLVADAWSKIDPNSSTATDDMHNAMQALADQGVTTARQFLSVPYTSEKARQVTTVYGAASPQEGFAAAQSGPYGVIPPASPAQIAEWDGAFAHMTADQLNGILAKRSAMETALEKVAASPNHAQTWDEEARALGISNLVGPYSGLKAYNAYAQARQIDDYLRNRLLNMNAGVPAPPAPTEIKDVGDAIYSVTPYGPNGQPSATALTTPPPRPGGMSGTFMQFDPATGRWVETTGGLGGAVGGVGAGMAPSQFAAQIIGSESGGNPSARNPASSATGAGQFLDATWAGPPGHPEKGILAQMRPDLAQGKTREQILALRTDPNLSAQAVEFYATQNGSQLQQAGQPVNSTTLAIAHRLGVGDAETVLKSPPNTPLASILSPAVLKANPDLRGKTAGQFASDMASKFGIQPVQIGGVTPGATAPASTSDLVGGAAASASGLSGDALLKTLDPATASQVKAIAEGRMQVPSNFFLRSPLGQKLAALTAQYDPSFDAANYAGRVATRKAFTAGVPAQNLTSLNTAVGHLDTLYNSIDRLRNFTGAGTMLNAPANAIAAATDPDYQRARAAFDAARGTVASELVRALRGSGGAEKDIQYWLSQFDPNKSPDSLRQAAQTAGDLLESRLEPLREQYQQGMGTTDDPFQVLYPQAAAKLARLTGGGTPQSGPSGPRLSPQQAHALPPGTEFVGLDGITRVRH